MKTKTKHYFRSPKPGKNLLPLNFRTTQQFIFIALLLSLATLLQSCETDIDKVAPVKDESVTQAAFSDRLVDLQLVADGFVSPTGLVASPDETKRLFVIDQVGKVWIIDQGGNTLPDPFIDVSSKMVSLNAFYDERGLLGMAFHPDFSLNGRFFLYYTAPATDPDLNNISRISEFRVSSDPNSASISSEKIILEVDQPQGNHEGGTIAFGPDGYLYISIGDGGAAHDVGTGHVEDWYDVNEGGNGQDIEANLLGNILRIDVNSGSPYSIPFDNPFVGKAGLDEIYAYGFRNPFRFSFDMKGSRKLYVGDAGQHLWEEVSIVEKGGNYGWNVKEGTHCFSTENPLQVLSSCPDVDIYGNRLIDPVIEMKNIRNPEGGRTITIIGGNVYRGNSIPGFQGKYIFGSFAQNFVAPNGELFIANPAGPGLWSFHELQLAGNSDGIGHYVRGFGQDLDGEIYVTASTMLGPRGVTGKVFKLVAAGKEKKDKKNQ